MLGPQQFGAFAGVAALAVMLGTLATFGTHLVLLGEVSKDPARRSQVLCYAVPLTLLCGSALLGIYLLICTYVLADVGFPLIVLIVIGVTETLLQPFFVLPTAEHLALGRVARSQLLQTLPLAVRLVSAAAVFFFAPADPLTAYSFGYLTASLVALAIASATMPAPWPAIHCWRLPSGPELRNAAGYAAINVTTTSPAELDKTLAAKLLPLGFAGLYAAGARVIGATTLPVIALMLSALPRLFRDSRDRSKQAKSLLRLIFAAALTYSIALAVVLWLIAPVFVWLFGPKYQGIEHTIRWLTLAVPGIACRLAAGNVLMTLGKAWMRVGFELFGLAILIAAAATLVAHLGVSGMPLALVCSEWGMALLGWAMIWNTLNPPASALARETPDAVETRRDRGARRSAECRELYKRNP
jgi:O-antigen/teichoic acid export membrane protein